jgi:hypothetical protein
MNAGGGTVPGAFASRRYDVEHDDRFKAVGMKRGLGALAAAGVLLAVYGKLVHPWLRTWRATEEELRGPWPGDELVDRIVSTTTRAITIDAPPAAVWPWIVQIGQDRAGFYSYRVLENAVGADMPNVRWIVPEFQHRAVGDTVRLASAKRFGKLGRMIVARLEPQRAMILVMPDDAARAFRGEPIAGGTWGFILSAHGGGATRLIMRSVDASHPPLAARALRALLFDSAHFIMERKMMIQIKRLAEQTHPARFAGPEGVTAVG